MRESNMKTEDRITQLLRKCDYEAWDPASAEFHEQYPRAAEGIIKEGVLAFPDGTVLTGLTLKEGVELVDLIIDEGIGTLWHRRH
jgi:hypothetical protein